MRDPYDLPGRCTGVYCTPSTDENGQNQNGEVYLYRFSRTEKGDPMLANIDDDAEYQAAATAFDIVLDNARKAEAAGAPLE